MIEPSIPVEDGSCDNANGDLIIRSGQEIKDPKSGKVYQARTTMGAGQFGHVYKVVSDGKSYAMKISKNDDDSIEQFTNEAEILEFLTKPEVHRLIPTCSFDTLVTFENAFEYCGHMILVTEALGPSLFKIIEGRRFAGIDHTLLQSVMRDILAALNTLARLKIVHTDVKPENILQLSISSQKVKLIDFGNAIFVDDNACDYAQTRYYRSPEVVLRHEITSKCDIWSLACVAAELKLGLPLLPGQSEKHLLWLINRMFGPIPEDMVLMTDPDERAIYFNEDGTFKSEQQLCEGTDIKDFSVYRNYFVHTQLRDILMSTVRRQGVSPDFLKREAERAEMLLDLLQQMLKIDPNERITAENALKHPYITSDFSI